jgi:hypothetical protein
MDEERRDASPPPANDATADLTPEERVWIVDVGEGQVHLVRGTGALKKLIADRGLPKTTSVYLLSTTAQTLGEVTEVRSVFESEPAAVPAEPEPQPQPAPSAPAVELREAPAEVAQQELAAPDHREAPAVAAVAEVAALDHDEEFALLDRPFDDGEYFEDPSRSRWLRPAGVAALVVSLAFGGYSLVHSRSGRHWPVPPQEPENRIVAAPAPPIVEPAVVIRPTSPAPPALEPPQVAAAAPHAALDSAGSAPAAAQVPVAAPSAPSRSIPEPVAEVAPTAQLPTAASSPPSHRYPELVAEGQRQFQGGHTGRAQALFEQALLETPEGNDALVGLGYVHLDRGKVAQAIALFQRALAQDRADPTALFGLAESHRQSGNRRAALAEFQRFLTLRSTGSDADIARQLVQDLASGG